MLNTVTRALATTVAGLVIVLSATACTDVDTRTCFIQKAGKSCDPDDIHGTVTERNEAPAGTNPSLIVNDRKLGLVRITLKDRYWRTYTAGASYP